MREDNPIRRVRRQLAVITVALLAAGSIPSPAIVGAEVAPDEIQDAVRFRTELGFRADLPFVALAAQDSVGFPNQEWSVPLTSDEATEVSRRVAVQLSLTEARKYARGQAGFAGVYIDQHDGGVPVFLFTGDAEWHRPEIERRLPAGTRFRVLAAARSYADLEGIRSEIDAARKLLRGEGIDVLLTGIHPPTNTLLVGVQGLTPSAETALKDRFGQGISVRDEQPAEADACTFTSCWPPKGGFEIKAPNGTTCTSGFVSKRETGTLALLTAGHCVTVGGGAGQNWKHNGMTIGPALASTWVNGADADAAFITINTSSIPPAKNLYIDVPPDTHALTVVVDWWNQDVGNVICRTGITSSKDCGTVVAEDVSRPSCVQMETNCRTIDHTWEVSFDSTGGDSGGPYHVGITTGYGIHVHSNVDGTPNAHGWYSPLGWVRSEYLQRYNILFSFCISADCSTTWP